MSPPERPETDPLTELLTAFPLPITFAGSLSLTAPWGLSVPQNAALFGVLTGNPCWLTGQGMEEAVAIAPGDFVAVSPACEYRLSDQPGSPAVSIDEIVPRENTETCASLACGGGGVQSGLIGGVLRFNGHGIHPLYSALPPVLHLSRQHDQHASEFGVILYAIEREIAAGRPGTRAIASHLAQILLIQAARLYLAESGGQTFEALQGLLHRDLGPALALIHRQPDEHWTVASLAERANMSRSAFSAVFAKVLGVPPVHYLREHRMRTACRLLQDPTLGLKEVSSRVGYDSVSAFSTAFKRYSGSAPGDFRRQDMPSSLA
ncbi:MAG: AraC family transcriptional regulator [Planctomycetaceae bacterium]|nr:AraC family transcriptional regulator [Planctomycetaceae bacterium]